MSGDGFDNNQTISHPDIVLGGIPCTLIAAYSAELIFNIGAVAIAGGLVVCCMLMLDGLFWHAPVE